MCRSTYKADLAMSFGFSIGDIISITQVAWKTTENTKRACVEYNDIVHDIAIQRVLLSRLNGIMLASDSLLSLLEKHDLSDITIYYGGQLGALELMLERFSKLSESKGGLERLWQMVKFGNGRMHDLANIRTKLANYNTTITFLLLLILLDPRIHGKTGVEYSNSGSEAECKTLG
jgi:hypothetical protein